MLRIVEFWRLGGSAPAVSACGSMWRLIKCRPLEGARRLGALARPGAAGIRAQNSKEILQDWHPQKTRNLEHSSIEGLEACHRLDGFKDEVGDVDEDADGGDGEDEGQEDASHT